MSSYKKNAAGNRDALFGGLESGGGGGGGSSSGGSRPKKSSASSAKGYSRSTNKKKSSGGVVVSALSEEAQAAKLKEAEENRQKANKCMQKGFMKKPDPVAASTYFKRAADAYQALGNFHLERLYRTESANCNVLCGAWASAASDFTRAAEIILQENVVGVEEETDQPARRDAAELHKKAADAWTEMNEKAKAAACHVSAALALNSGNNRRITKEALAGMEEAVEAHVPDPLNPFARYRQTGHSAYIDPENTGETPEKCSPETRELAKAHLVQSSYAHEPLQQLVYLLTGCGEYASALYAAGAAETVLMSEGLSTLTLSRAFVTETILLLALGDPVGAEQVFLNRHVQKDFYLKARECQLAEELFRAVKNRDEDALDEARDMKRGPNRSALGNLPHENLRTVVQELRISGVARRKDRTTTPTAAEHNGGGGGAKVKEEKPLADVLNAKTGYEHEAAAGAHMDGEALSAELDDLDLSGGLGEDDDEDSDEDDFDLR